VEQRSAAVGADDESASGEMPGKARSQEAIFTVV